MMRVQSLPARLLSASVLSTLLPCASAFAQAAGAQIADASAPANGVDDIVVTARQRAETVLDVPLSVNTFSAVQIERERIETFADVARLSSSLVFDKGFSLQDTRPTIRGLPSSRGRPPVGVLIDGVDTSSESMGSSAGGSSLLNLRSLDVERIEVVKGPQSALYGRVAFGGAINYITKQPSQTFGAEVSGEAAEYGTYEVRAALTGPVNPVLSYRINGYHAESDGNFVNLISGKHINGYDSWGGGIALKYDPGSPFHAILNLTYGDDRYTPAAQYYIGSLAGVDVPIALPAGIAGTVVGTTSASAPLPATTLGPPRGTLSIPSTGIRLSLNPLTGRDYPGSHVAVTRAVLHMNYDFDWGTLSSISSVLHARFSESEDTDFFGAAYAPVTLPPPGGLAEPLPRAQQSNLNHGQVTQLNQELRVGHLNGGPFRWAVGGLFWYERYTQNNQSATYVVPNGSAGLDILLDQPTLPDGPGSRVTNHESVYGLAEYDFLTHFTASVEGRYAVESYNYIFSPYLVTSGTGATGPAPVTIAAQPTPQSSSTNYFTPKFLLRYEPTSDLNIYASAAKGVKPAGFSTVAVLNSSTAGFKTEKLWNYELGFKARFFDRKVSLNSAIFRMDYTDKQISLVVTDPRSPTGFSSIIANAGGARVNGAEVELTFQPTRDIFISGSYTYLDAKYTNYVVNANSGLVGSLLKSCTPVQIGTGLFCQGNLAGNSLERAPKHSIVGQGRYSHEIANDLRGFLEGDVRYTSRRPVEEYGAYFTPPVTTVNLRAGLETKKWSAFVFANNVFNENKLTSALFVGDTFQPGTAALIGQPTDPRQVGVRFSYRY